MKTLTNPESGACGEYVAYVSPYGQCRRARICQKNNRTPAQQRMRAAFGYLARAWSAKLTQQQRDRWNLAGPKAWSHARMGSGPLTGQQHFQAINSSRACIEASPLWEPPQPVVLPLNPVGELAITNDEHGVRLFLKVTGPVTEDIMVFGQAPCSAGRSKRRNVSYLGLLPPPVNGLSEITGLYKARFGEPKPRTKVFIVTVQQKNGWEGPEKVTREVVPDKPEGQSAATTTTLSLQPNMHKGSTRDAQGLDSPQAPGTQEGNEPPTPGGKAAKAALEGGDVAAGESGPPG